MAGPVLLAPNLLGFLFVFQASRAFLLDGILPQLVPCTEKGTHDYGCYVCTCEFHVLYLGYRMQCEARAELKDCPVTQAPAVVVSTAAANTVSGGSSAPRIVKITPDVLVKPRNNLTLLCEASGNPPPVILWEFIPDEGHQKVDLGMGSSLTVSQLDHSKTGVYICKALSNLGIATANLTLGLQDTLPVITKRPGNVVASVGDVVTLACAAYGDPAPVISWGYVDSSGFPSSISSDLRTRVDHNGYLHITHLDTDNAGDYVCRATNRAGMTTATATVSLLQE